MIKRAALLLILAVAFQPPAHAPFPLEEATASQLQDWMTAGRYTSRQLVEMYLKRIDDIDRSGPTLRSILEINPDASRIADALDAERKATGPRGPLHGIPVVIKDRVRRETRFSSTACARRAW